MKQTQHRSEPNNRSFTKARNEKRETSRRGKKGIKSGRKLAFSMAFPSANSSRGSKGETRVNIEMDAIKLAPNSCKGGGRVTMAPQILSTAKVNTKHQLRTLRGRVRILLLSPALVRQRTVWFAVFHCLPAFVKELLLVSGLYCCPFFSF